jgi:hypothetical protein
MKKKAQPNIIKGQPLNSTRYGVCTFIDWKGNEGVKIKIGNGLTRTVHWDTCKVRGELITHPIPDPPPPYSIFYGAILGKSFQPAPHRPCSFCRVEWKREQLLTIMADKIELQLCIRCAAGHFDKLKEMNDE